MGVQDQLSIINLLLVLVVSYRYTPDIRVINMLVGELKQRLIQFCCNPHQDIINKNQRYCKNKAAVFLVHRVYILYNVTFEVRLNFLWPKWLWVTAEMTVTDLVCG